MTQNPGQDPNQPDPYHHDPDAPQPERTGGYQAAPSAEGSGYGAAPAQAVAKPQPVGLAQKLMYAGGVLSLVSGLTVLFSDEETLRQQMQEEMESAGQTVDPAMVDAAVMGAMWGGPIFGVIVAAIWFLLAVFNGKGKGWARIVATVLGALNIVGTLISLAGVGGMPGMGSGGALNLVLSLLSAAIAAAVIFLLWRKESSAYFAATR
ncbi:hypothetical protein ACI3EY_16455 [Ornithinimicrobium sp. LYQ92]|uniref:hypothetical protein n=1 Tax=Serinicoccus sp. LYQ92 TaxID=3378798 RepID=UPI0038546D6F